MKNMKWRDAILTVMRESGQPMHYTDIAQAIIDQGYRTEVGATPSATVAANLGHPQIRDQVQRIKTGVYRLTEAAPGLPLRPSSDVTKSGYSTSDVAPVSPPAVEVDAVSVDEEMGLINAFGMFWRRTEVDWTSRSPQILGVQQSGSAPVDFSGQAGVYLLYDGNKVVYVGRVTEPRLGQRMWEHTRDRLTGRWDRFSWFGVRRTNESGILGPIPAASIAIGTLIATMEALLIEGLEPPQNRRQGDGFSALEFIQVTDPEVERRRKETILAEVMTGLKAGR